MNRNLLLGILIVSLLVELGLAFGIFFARPLMMQQFGVQLTPDTSFLGYVVAWLLLFVSLICGLAIRQVWQRQADFSILCYLLGFWWIGIGIGIYVAFGKPDNLYLDSIKGLLIVVLTRLNVATMALAQRSRPTS